MAQTYFFIVEKERAREIMRNHVLSEMENKQLFCVNCFNDF